jgi:hypothetical protein
MLATGWKAMHPMVLGSLDGPIWLNSWEIPSEDRSGPTFQRQLQWLETSSLRPASYVQSLVAFF